MKSSLLICLAMAGVIALCDPAPAEACGGCFVQATERTVVTDHRMAIAITPTQTVLWDQIRYSGDPAEFAWVLPVKSGATIQLSNDEFFTALDASTQPVVRAPSTYGGMYGCGLTGCGSSETSDSNATGVPGAGQVQIVSQSVIGPYETVTLRATDPLALRNWLKSHAYEIPPAVEPTVDAYVREKFDFIALRLRPDCGERAMQPVRVVSPGADPTLPLRMVAAGIGARVGLTVYVISEGRWQPQNFPHAVVDPSDVQWDRTQQKSNYESLTEQIMARADGRTWVVEYADRPELYTFADPRFPVTRSPDYQMTGRPNGVTPGLADTYYAQCRTRVAGASATAPSASGSASAPSAQPFTPCRNGSDAGVGDAGASADADASADASASVDADADAGEKADADADADAEAGEEADAGAEAGADTGADTDAGDGLRGEPMAQCLYLDDIDVAIKGLHPQDVWVTRLRAQLPANALADGDLLLEAASDQGYVSSVYTAGSYSDESSAGQGGQNACLSAPKRHTAFGSWAFAAIGAIAAVAFLRRQTRPRRR